MTRSIITRWPLAAALLAATCFGAAVPATAETSRYSEWKGDQESGGVDSLIENLRGLIEEGERARAADPMFLEDLRNVLDAFENPWGVRALYDDFRDGNFTANPTWQISAGQWKIDRSGATQGLKSNVGAPQIGGNLNNLLGALLQPQQGTAQYASIYTPVKFGNPFAMRFEFGSRDAKGRLDFGPYQGAAGNIAYRLAYIPGAANGLLLQRVTAQGTTVIGQSPGPLNLSDGRAHVVELTRDKAGRMEALVDGNSVISVQDTRIRGGFDGFLIINSAGSFGVRSVSVDSVN